MITLNKNLRKNLVKVILVTICMLQTVTTWADQITINGIKYDMPDVINGYVYKYYQYAGVNCVHASVAGVSNDFAGALVIPASPGKITCTTFKVYDIRVVEIKSSACDGNLKITSVTFPITLISYGKTPFNDCNFLTSFNVEEGNPAFSSLDGVLYNKDKTTIVQYPINKANPSFTVPATVNEIADHAFDKCLNLLSVVLTDNVTTVGDKAFAHSKIKSATFSKSVNRLGYGIFIGSLDFKDIIVFWNDPSEVRTSDTFDDMDQSSVTLYVPSGTKAAYLASDVWKDFNIVEGAGITGQYFSNFVIYPNPTTTSFFIECENITAIKLYDMLGREVLTQPANTRTEVNISHLPKGVYGVHVLSGDSVVGKSKIVK